MLRSAEVFERGAEGEESTARVLASLPSDEWRVFHDVRWPARRYANIDHVVVGPSGVFVIDSKAWSGSIEVRSGALRQDGRRRSRAVSSAAAAAMAVHELFPRLDIKAVNPVLCFVRREPVFGWSGDVMVCSTENVVTFLTSRPRRFDESEVVEIAGALSITLEVAHAPLRSSVPSKMAPSTMVPASVAPPAPAPAAARPTRAPRPGRPTIPEPLRVLLRIGLLAAVIALAFQLDLPARLGHLGSQATQRVLAPTEPIGTPVNVPAMGSRPSLDVVAGTPVFTKSTMSGVRPSQGHQLVAVPLRIENTGDTVWRSDSDIRTGITDATDVSYSSDPAFTSVAAGEALPAKLRLPAGRTTSGLVVFEVPVGTQVAKVQVTVGPGLPKTLRWSVG